MDRQFWMVVFGISAIALYTLSWVFQLMHWPGKDLIRIASAIPFLIGLSILLYDRWKRNNHQKKSGNNDWSDILDEEDENN